MKSFFVIRRQGVSRFSAIATQARNLFPEENRLLLRAILFQVSGAG